MGDIRETRKKLGLNQKEIGLFMDIPQKRISEIETGYEGRRETKGHIRLALLIEFIADHGLLDELATKLKAT